MRDDFTWPRVANIILGIWLFISAFAWPHTYAQMTNTWIVGLLCVVFAVIAMRVPEARYLNTVLSIWLTGYDHGRTQVHWARISRLPPAFGERMPQPPAAGYAG